MSTVETCGNDDPICAAIDAAEEVRDPMEGLVERTAAGAAFRAPDVLAAPSSAGPGCIALHKK